MSSAAGTTPGAVGVSRWWRVVGGLLMNLALGSLYAWSVFVAPLEKEFGWKRADTSNVFTVAVVVFAISFITMAETAGGTSAQRSWGGTAFLAT